MPNEIKVIAVTSDSRISGTIPAVMRIFLEGSSVIAFYLPTQIPAGDIGGIFDLWRGPECRHDPKKRIAA